MRILALLSIILVALSGCTDTEPETEEPEVLTTEDATESAPPSEAATDVDDKTETTPTNATANETVPANQPPQANLTADLLEGQAPVEVVFTVQVADDDGDALQWSLDADGDGIEDANGTDLADVTFVYDVAGTYLATLNVTDGLDNATATVEIVVTEKPPVVHQFSCTVVLGYGLPEASVTISGLPVNLGGCSLGTVSGNWVVVESTPGASCDIQADLDGDGFSDEGVVPGNVYANGHTITAFCYFGAVDATNTVVFHEI